MSRFTKILITLSLSLPVSAPGFALEVCGNGVIDPGEQCDDAGVPGGCKRDCTCPAFCHKLCGNGVLDSVFEVCDDGNRKSKDSCDAFCQCGDRCDELCGDGIVNTRQELCDDGPDNGLAGFCNETCDGIVSDGSEGCDDFLYDRPIDELNGGGQAANPSISADGLEIFFQSDRPGGVGLWDIWTATRASQDDPWGDPTPVVGVNSPLNEDAPFISADGLTLYFSRNNFSNNYIFQASRAAVGQPFGMPVPRPELGGYANGPTLSGDELTLYFASGRSAAANDLFVATRLHKNGPFSQIRTLPNLSSPVYEGHPDLSRDGLAIVFHSNRLEGPGTGDLWIAERTDVGDPFGPPQQVGGVNGPTSAESGPTLVDNRQTLYYMVNPPSPDFWSMHKATCNR